MFGVKILTNIWSLKELENKKYVHIVEYLHLSLSYHNLLSPNTYCPDDIDHFSNGLDRYKEILDQCINLKAIEICADDHLSINLIPNLLNPSQQIWRERILYLQARGIRLAGKNEIHGNENLKMKLVKEAGITWKFHFQ